MFQKIKRFFADRKISRMTKKIELKDYIWSQTKLLIDVNNTIDKEMYERKKTHKSIKIPSWSKLFLIFLFINFTALEVFTGWVTIYSFKLSLITGMSPDLTPLITLIGAVIGETISYGIYCAKSKAENTKDGIIFESAMQQVNQNIPEEEEAQG